MFISRSTNVVVAPAVVASPIIVAPVAPVFGGWGYGWSPFAPTVSIGFGFGGFGSFLFFFELFAGLFVVAWVWSFISGIFNRKDGY